VVDDQGVGDGGDPREEPLGIGDRVEGRDRHDDLHAVVAQAPRGGEARLDGSGGRRQTGQAIAVALDRDVDPQVAAASELHAEVDGADDSVAVGLQDQLVGRLVSIASSTLQVTP
jgi:hypothetical protein